RSQICGPTCTPAGDPVPPLMTAQSKTSLNWPTGTGGPAEGLDAPVGGLLTTEDAVRLASWISCGLRPGDGARRAPPSICCTTTCGDGPATRAWPYASYSGMCALRSHPLGNS